MEAVSCGRRPAAPFKAVRSTCRTVPRVRVKANSMVSRDSLPEQYKYADKYKLHFVCFSRLAPEQTTAALQEALPQHQQWLRQQQQQGRLAFHGDFLNPEADNYGSGMYALFADSTPEAKELAGSDPLHASGIRKFEMLPWVQQLRW
ncbi:hypothetical protein COO60DRAFT_1703116 [Scenedesmus sp. NREL 46B-D3]|nr:hypothetical protein COO60DRAFT_1703116 [Scenedesmus sp. NREL 46B-D3]